ncbi:MAG: small basic protein [Candidatus Omnitrophica bacterium]|nr:small basic protein [Candidatus Omnitrophota bacterium]
MSQHKSLKSASKDKKIRSVLNRFEKISKLKERGKWNENDSVFGLPKVKVMKLKLKKQKPKEAEEKAAEEAEKSTKEEAQSQKGKEK